MTPESLGLEGLIFVENIPLVDANGAVAYPVSLKNPDDQPTFVEKCIMLSHLIRQGHYLYTISCAIEGCGANALADQPSTDSRFFSGGKGLQIHCRAMHQDAWNMAFGKGCVGVEEFLSCTALCRITPVTSDDLKVILTGPLPPSCALVPCKRSSSAGDANAVKQKPEPVMDESPPQKKRRMADSEEEQDGIFMGTRSRSPQKQGTKAVRRSCCSNEC